MITRQKISRTCWMVFIAIIFIFHSMNLNAQLKTLPFRYNPVIISGEEIPVERFQIDDWNAYAYYAATETWQLIPFQIDEIDGNGDYLNESDGILDENDELVFMPNDAMDRATGTQWLNDVRINEPIRVELVLTNSKYPDRKAWAYLYKTDEMLKEGQGYIDYIPARDNSPADTIQTSSYKLGHNAKGWTNHVSLSNNWDKDLLDRIKFHINSKGLVEIFLTEDTLNFATEKFYKKPVRSFQKVRSKIQISVPPFDPINKEDSFLITFLPYSTWIGAGFTVDENTKNLLVLMKIKNIRLSIDLSSDVNDMRFYSKRNPDGFPIDGIPDSPDIQLPDSTGINWVMASGRDGTMLAFFEFPMISGADGKFIYYRDDKNGGTNEQTPDTGDMKSFGDMGLWITGDALIPQSNELFVAFTTYYIDETNQDAAFGTKLLREIKHPLAVTATVQTKQTDVVDNETNYPSAFRLYDAFPNPYHAHHGTVTFRFKTRNFHDDAFLVVYNVNGQEVARFHVHSNEIKNGVYEWHWRARSKQRRLLPSGVYFYKLIQGNHSQIKKLLIVH